MLVVEVETCSPRLHVLRWRGDGDPDEASREKLAQLVVSRTAGAFVACVAPDARALPAAFAGLLGDAPFLDVPFAEARLTAYAPRGRGKVLHLAPIGEERIEAVLDAAAKSAGQRELERQIEAALDAMTDRGAELGIQGLARDGHRVAPSELAGFLHPGQLDPADPIQAARFRHEIEGGERFAEKERLGRGSTPHVGRLARGRESFELRLRADEAPFAGFSLVVTRLTSPVDRRALLRVELDDEDLGPWRIGAEPPERWSSDHFRISSTLLAGRKSLRLSFAPVSAPEVGSFRWSFFAEREIEGIRVDELEGRSRRRSPEDASTTRAPDGTELCDPVTGIARRMLLLRADERVEYSIPRGYSRFESTVSPLRVRGAAAGTLVVELDGVDVARWEPSDSTIQRSVGLGGATTLALRVESASDAFARLDEPALLR
jgi:hypothetical protein